MNMACDYDEQLYHFGIKGMKWGVRRYQNKDGSLTNAGQKRAENYRQKEISRLDKTYNTSALSKKINRNTEKLKNMRNADDPRSEKQYAKLRDKLESERYQYNYKQAMKTVEKNKLNNMTLSQLDKERTDVGSVKTANVMGLIGSTALAMVSPVVRISYTDTTVYKTNRRVGSSERNNAMVDAYVKTKKDMESIK